MAMKISLTFMAVFADVSMNSRLLSSAYACASWEDVCRSYKHLYAFLFACLNVLCADLLSDTVLLIYFHQFSEFLYNVNKCYSEQFDVKWLIVEKYTDPDFCKVVVVGTRSRNVYITQILQFYLLSKTTSEPTRVF